MIILSIVAVPFMYRSLSWIFLVYLIPFMVIGFLIAATMPSCGPCGEYYEIWIDPSLTHCPRC